ncbi:MoaD/ThiS family protein [Terrimonas pollutisoli]|uniref:MoaD/ThiS family protein n=1 Tax=Terrimonas pollutisoli TaxID=3034147 RepID=UPI0023EE281C|nr:MoaD/ThiS family protein [Terrimonas sp. H1YJ31]
MQIRILIFGKLADIVNTSTLTLTGIEDTNSLVNELNKRYPALADCKYIMAVDKQTITTNTILKGESTIALLPPFSGG